MPKNFVFYNPEHHQRIYALLEKKKPAAIVTATAKNPELVGALYPFPLIADGDFDIPSAYCTDVVGWKIADRQGQAFSLRLEAERVPASAANVVAQKNPQAERKVVITSHIDAYEDTPGAELNPFRAVTTESNPTEYSYTNFTTFADWKAQNPDHEDGGDMFLVSPSTSTR